MGVFSQPHLHDFQERWRLDGAPLGDEAFVRCVAALPPLVDELARRHPGAGEPSTFELTVVLAALAFAETDLAVFEVGLGGRLDPVNALHPSLTLMTSIGHDHVHILGGSLSAIARDKSATMRPGIVAFSAVQPRVAERELARAAERLSARRAVVEPLRPAGRAVLGEGQPVLLREQVATLALLGPHQRQNAALAVAAARELGLPDEAVGRGLAQARWPGRLEYVAGDPPLLLDGAHNPEGARALAAALVELAPRARYALVFGCARDKDAAGLLRPLARRASRVWTVAARDPRAADPGALAAIIPRAEPAGSVTEGLRAARASGAELILVAGSLRIVAEARQEVFA